MALSLGFLSTYPPTQCGIATFCEALVTHLAAEGAAVGVVRLVDEPQPDVPHVVAQWVTGRPADAALAAAALDGFDVAVIQHEYGIFGGADGVDVIDVVSRLHVPVVTVLHTVLATPTPQQHRVLAWLVDYSDAIVTMTETARDRLVAGWGVEPARVTVIPHGARDNRALRPSRRPTLRSDRGTRPTVLTWGLLSQGKGIEWALHAMAELRGRIDLPLYQVVGQTHPRVRETDGEAYRESLLRLTAELHLQRSVTFDDRYLTESELRAVVRAADVVLLPYDSPEQVTSGVLTEAVAAGKPVVSTAFPHAIELLSGGAGVVVPRRDPMALADALERVLAGPGIAADMAAAAHDLATSVLWPAVARRYVGLAGYVMAARSATVA